MNKDFVQPTTRAEAEERRRASIERVQDIQTQLGNRNREVDGVRLNDRDYWAWRAKATFALKCENVELRNLNAWLKAHNSAAQNAVARRDLSDFDLKDVFQALLAAHNLLQRLARETDLDEEERAVVDAVREFAHDEAGRRAMKGEG